MKDARLKLRMRDGNEEQMFINDGSSLMKKGADNIYGPDTRIAQRLTL